MARGGEIKMVKIILKNGVSHKGNIESDINGVIKFRISPTEILMFNKRIVEEVIN